VEGWALVEVEIIEAVERVYVVEEDEHLNVWMDYD
jgi:hypothetical protein